MTFQQLIGTMTGRFGKLPNPENTQVARKCATEGIVLLKNDGVLPLQTKKVALFGAGAVDTIICGTGSGYVFPAYKVTVQQGLENAGLELTSKSWLTRFAKTSKEANKKDKTLNFLDKMWSGKSILIDEIPITDGELQEARTADTAIYVIRRNAGEENDRKAVRGDYYLSEQEEANIRHVAAAFRHTVVVLNTCVIDAGFVNEIPGIDAVVYLGLAGMEAGNALADILTGRENPSGKLTDTWAKQYSDYPAAEVFSSNDGVTAQEDYIEDIYVGYRWFDSMGIEPLYPFGFGLSYTEFKREVRAVSADWDQVQVEVAVTNTGKYPGRDVVQLYTSAPQGRLEKPYQELKAFAKTGLLAPGDTETVKLIFATENLASLDEIQSAYIMEPGRYLLRIGCDSRNTHVAAVIELDAETVTRRVSDVLKQDKPMETKHHGKVFPMEAEGVGIIRLKAAQRETVDNISKIPKMITTYVPEGTAYTPYMESNPYQMPYPCKEVVKIVRHCPVATFLDVYHGKVTMEEFVASLEPEVLTRVVMGILEESPYETRNRLNRKIKLPATAQSSGQTTAQFLNSLGLPVANLFDGPAGMHIVGCAATSFPVGMTAAQTWNPELLREMGVAYGKDMESFHVTVALGPGMNIHRDPLCGRNFEYYSEDPLLTGKTAAAFTRGVQSIRGRGVAIKHFAANNQENDRLSLNNTITARALREIYLKGFEICVREARPMTLMTSYNQINGIYTGSNRELVTDILRGEWGFGGYVMSDWGTSSEKGWDLHAGNDLIMGGYRAEKLLAMMKAEAPAFAPDGAVQETVKSAHFGMVKSYLSNWGSFVPSDDGADTVSTTVAPGTAVSAKVEELVKQGIASVTKNPDGSHMVTYRGTNRGAYLALGDLQACAIRILNGLMHSAAMDEMLRAMK